MQQRNRTNYIVIHTAAWPGDPSVEDIRRVHVQENGWEDIGYHFVVRKDGRIEPGRPVDMVGAHCRSEKMNYKSIGICCSGDGDDRDFTGKQKESVRDICRAFMKTQAIPIEHVIGHREAGAHKTCPGTKVHMDKLRAFIAKSRTDDTIELDYLSGMSGAQHVDTKQLQKLYINQPVTNNFEDAGKKEFNETAFGRTLTGKNKTGKLIYGLAGMAVSVFTGMNIQPITNILTGNQTGILPIITNDMDIWSIILMVIGALITLATTRGLLKGLVNDIARELEDVVNSIQQARQADSPGGKAITPEEKLLILKEADDIAITLWNRLVRSRLLRFFGLEKKPEKGKS